MGQDSTAASGATSASQKRLVTGLALQIFQTRTMSPNFFDSLNRVSAFFMLAQIEALLFRDTCHAKPSH